MSELAGPLPSPKGAGEILNPETVELFRNYRESHRDVFMDEILSFIRGANCTELDAIYEEAVVRAKSLRTPTGRKRGRPTRLVPAPEIVRSGAAGSELTRLLNSGQRRPLFGDDTEFEEMWLRDQKAHGWFRDVCMVCGDLPASRPLLLEQTLLFIQGADRSELWEIRKILARRRKMVRRSRRGRPDVRTDEELMCRARLAVWMRVIERRTDREIARALEMPVVEPIQNEKQWIEVRGNIESLKRQLQRLENYLAAAIWRAIPPSYIRACETHRQIAPGALDNRSLQTFIRHHTGLPFRTHPEECKCIIQELWPRGLTADLQMSKPGFTYRAKKRHP